MRRVALALVVFAACRAHVPVARDDAFLVAVEAGTEDQPARAANAAWVFLQGSEPDDPRYDRALMWLGRGFEDLGLTHAAGRTYREVAQARRTMELVPQALRGVERIVQGRAYDRDGLLTSFVAAEDFGRLPPDVAAFVDYERGLELVRRGDDAWADVQLAAIPADSPYADHAEYLLAVRDVADGQDTSAWRRLTHLAEEGEPDVGLDARRALARIAFEHERYDLALVHLEALRDLAPDDADILLETAWTHYWLGDSRKALGLLLALDAPVHAATIAPERYLLEALSWRRLCQYDAARTAAVRLKARHGTELEALQAGALPHEIPTLREAAGRRADAVAETRYLRALQDQGEAARHLPLDKDLKAYLAVQYDRAVEEAERREEAVLRDAAADLGEELLAAEEGTRLIVHELGVSLLRGHRRPAGAEEADPPKIRADQALFAFRGEFWTDEMDDLLVLVEDRCID